MPIFINPRFPKTKKEYDKAGDDNTDKLKEVMSKLLIQEQAPPAAKEPVKPSEARKARSLRASSPSSARQGGFPRSELTRTGVKSRKRLNYNILLYTVSELNQA